MVYSLAFGLGVWGNRHIPGLAPVARVARVDVRVWLGVMPSLGGEANDPASQVMFTTAARGASGEPVLRISRVAGGYYRFRYDDGTEFLIDRSGSRIWATWRDPWTVEDAATYLLGPIFGFVLRLRRVVCLHASAVALAGSAVVLVGPAGAGKSTTAAAFARLGFPVLSDDIVALEERGDCLLVHAGNPRLRLWSESAQILFGATDALPRLTPNWDKLYLDLGGNDFPFHKTPLPLGAVYVLAQRKGDSRAPFVELLTAKEGLMELVGNAYANCLLDRAMRAREFDLLGRLVRSMTVRRVAPHEDRARLTQLCDTLLEDFRGFRTQPEQPGVRARFPCPPGN